MSSNYIRTDVFLSLSLNQWVNILSDESKGPYADAIIESIVQTYAVLENWAYCTRQGQIIEMNVGEIYNAFITAHEKYDITNAHYIKNKTMRCISIIHERGVI